MARDAGHDAIMREFMAEVFKHMPGQVLSASEANKGLRDPRDASNVETFMPLRVYGSTMSLLMPKELPARATKEALHGPR